MTTTTTTPSTSRFDAEAAAWDSNPDVHRASASAHKALLAAFPDLLPLPPSPSPSTVVDVLEIGCGTGLLTLLLSPHVTRTVAVDASEGMISALRTKLPPPSTSPSPAAVVEPLCILLTDPEDPRLPPADDENDNNNNDSPKRRRKFDLVTSHLALHHIADVPALLRTVLGCLKPGTGWAALTDYEDFGPAARRFHPEGKMVGVERHGIPARWMAAVMEEVGFVDVHVGVAWTMEKEVERWPGEWGPGGASKPSGAERELMDFPFLLCRGRRPT